MKGIATMARRIHIQRVRPQQSKRVRSQGETEIQRLIDRRTTNNRAAGILARLESE